MAYAESRGKTWRVKYKKPNGSWASESGFETKKAALAWGRDQETDIRRNTWIDPRHAEEKFGDFAEKVFAAARLAISTRERYRSLLNAHILPQWGDWTLNAIFGGHLEIRAWVTKLHAQLAEPTVASVYYYFSQILEEAVRARKLPGNPARMVRVTTGGYEAEHQVATSVQVLRAAMRLHKTFGRAGMVLALLNSYTGMRWSEQVALRSCDYDNIVPAVPVRAPIRETGSGRMEIADKPKTPAGRRWVQLPPFLDALHSDLARSCEQEYLFTNFSGGWLRRTNFQYRFWRPAWDGDPNEQAWMRQSLVEGITFHEAGRHTHRTWLAEDGIPEVARAARLGHKLPGMAQVYEHVTPVMLKQVLRVLEARWAGSVSSLTEVERDHLFVMAPILEEQYRKDINDGVPSGATGG